MATRIDIPNSISLGSKQNSSSILPETNIFAPENRPKLPPQKNSTSNPSNPQIWWNPISLSLVSQPLSTVSSTVPATKCNTQKDVEFNGCIGIVKKPSRKTTGKCYEHVCFCFWEGQTKNSLDRRSGHEFWKWNQESNYQIVKLPCDYFGGKKSTTRWLAYIPTSETLFVFRFHCRSQKVSQDP